MLTINAHKGSLAPREQFPLLEKRIYINAAAIGLVPVPVQKEVSDFVHSMGTDGDWGYFKNSDALEHLPRKGAAALFHCNPEDIFFGVSISESLCNIAWSLRPAAGQNVVCVDVDIPATTMPWLRISEQTGCEVRFTDIAKNPALLSTEKVIELIDENTVAVCVSHVQWCTGHMLDLSAISKAAHTYGAIVMVDAMHTVGVIPIDVNTLDVDVMVHGSYKWMGAYAGVAATYIRPELCERLRPAFVGSGTPYMPPPFTGVDPTKLTYCPGASAFQYGSSAHVPKFSYGVASQYLQDIGIEAIGEHITGLADLLVQGLSDMGADVVTPKDHHAGVIMARFPGMDAMALYRKLEEAGIQTSCRMEGIRFSPGIFNNEEDIFAVLNAIEQFWK